MKFILAILLFAIPARGNDRVSVGYSETDITPPLGGSMPGYFRDRLSTGVLDPLLAKVLVLTKDRTTLAIVALDLIGLQSPEVAQIRKAIQQRSRIPGDHVFVHATHTHTGAQVPYRFTSDADKIYPGLRPGTVNVEWISQLPEKVATAVERAMSNRVPEERTTFGSSREDSIAFYRRFMMKDGTIRTNAGRGNPNIVRPAGEIDPAVSALSFETAKTLLVSYSLHPDCVGGTRYSADYPFHLTQTIRESLGKEWNVIYLNAACGNINHIDVKNVNQRSGHEESRRIGQILGRAALAARENSRKFALDHLKARTTIVQNPLRRVPEEIAKRAEQEIQAGVDVTSRNFNELFSPAAYVLSKTKDRTHPAEVVVFRIGNLGLVGLPAETFVEIARDIRQGSPLAHTLVIGLTGGAMGYMPHSKGFQEGGYEAGYRSARYEPQTPDLWIRAATRLLRSLK